MDTHAGVAGLAQRFNVNKRELAKWLSIAAIAILAFLGARDQAAAQAFDLRVGTGNDQPEVFDFTGGHHSCVYGYYGAPVPPFSDSSTPLLQSNGQDISYRLGPRALLDLQFSRTVGTCERSEFGRNLFASASSAHRPPRP
jgi:hypothetical protein